ncbi:hypothetical protein HB370_28860 [Streptomyces sp. DSM 40868]|uniref:hypothetical protein n=1 Tax=Streptomyces TaxID=1883 RepID=UPI0014288E3A|nr:MULTISPECIES: hypothetical protein [Streptomyces]QIS73508.1 hypothetical protein HB370_28860 [Streptomyces sp. DSM 40868]
MRVRDAAMVVAGCLVLLSGCGGGNSGGASPLDAGQAEAVLPDAAALPGWKASLEPVAYTLKKAKEMGVGECHDAAGQDSCAQVRFFGVAAFHQENEPDISFIVQTYRDEDTARAAYGTVWKAWKRWVPEARTVSAGNIGDQRDAVAGLSSSIVKGSKGLMIQTRVGSVIMMSMAEAGPHTGMADSYMNRFADVFAQRAGQAEAGERPSAGMTASAR